MRSVWVVGGVLSALFRQSPGRRAARRLAAGLWLSLWGGFYGTANGSEPGFDIYEYRVLGNSLLAISDIERAVYPFLGEGKSFADVEAARLALEQAFHGAGYGLVAVNIPEQQVVSGIVRLQVLEGRLDRMKISNARYVSLREIRESLPSLQRGELIDLQKTQQEIAALNRLSGDLSVTPVMRPGRSEGSVEVDLRVKDQMPVAASFTLNDRYTPGTRRLRASVSMGWENLWQKFHSFSLQYSTSPEDMDQVEVLVGTYMLPVNARRDRLAVYAVKSDSDVPAPAAESVLGAGEIFGARYVALWPSLAGYVHSSSLGIDYKNFDDTVVVTSEGENPQTEIDYLLFSGGYSGTFMGSLELGSPDMGSIGALANGAPARDEGRNNQRLSYTTRFGVSANFGVNGLANDFDEFADKRLVTLVDEANPNFFYLNANLDTRWQWSGYELGLGLDGQYTEDLLINNEQYGLGGVDSVRGYRQNENLADRGWNARLQFKTPELLPRKQALERGISTRLVAFYDYAEGSQVTTAPGETGSFRLAGTGLGLDFGFADRLTASAYWALALRDSGDIESGADRLHFDLKVDW